MAKLFIAVLILVLCVSIAYATDVSSCQNLTSANGVYTITQNLAGNQSNGRCIDIQANNITLNCAGFNITGADAAGTSGIYAASRTNITIKNCNVYDYIYGIYLYASSSNALTNNTARSNAYGIYLDTASYNNFTNNNANSNTDIGIYIYYYSNYNTLTNNTVNSNTNGVQVHYSSEYNTLTNNTVNSNSGTGVYFTGTTYERSSYNNLINNTITSNTNGIRLETSDNNNFIDNNVSSNGYGFYLERSGGNKMFNNIISSNSNSGVYLTFGASSNNLTNNTVNNNMQTGIVITFTPHKDFWSDYNFVISNIVNNNIGGGISLGESDFNTLSNNIVNNNTGDGISLSRSYSNVLTNNTANNNSKGISLYRSSGTLSNNIANSNAYGIYLSASYSNVLTNNTANNNTQIGVYLGDVSGSYYASSNSLINNIANSNAYGIYLNTAPSNTFTNNNATNNTLWDFYSTGSSTSNTITNLTTNNTQSSFTYNGNIFLKSATAPAGGDPPSYTNIGHYLNITNSSASAWIYLNVSYTDSDVANIDENSLKIRKNTSSAWTQKLNRTGTLVNGVDNITNIVYANISTFSGIYAPIGRPINFTYKLTPEPGLSFTLTNGIDVTLVGQNTDQSITVHNTSANKPIGIIEVNFEMAAENVTLPTITSATDATAGTAIFHNTSGAYPDEVTNRYLLVPWLGAGYVGYHCPSATVLDGTPETGVRTDCLGKTTGYTTIVNIQGIDYIQMPNPGGGNEEGGGTAVPEFSDIAYILAAVLGAGGFILARRKTSLSL